jgi:hypothetical protein
LSRSLYKPIVAMNSGRVRSLEEHSESDEDPKAAVPSSAGLKSSKISMIAIIEDVVKLHVADKADDQLPGQKRGDDEAASSGEDNVPAASKQAPSAKAKRGGRASGSRAAKQQSPVQKNAITNYFSSPSQGAQGPPNPAQSPQSPTKRKRQPGSSPQAGHSRAPKLPRH